ncbi:hypothetical protein RJT34_02351 [Clitoria ternatea]|uniref:Uncharacterized protein n=1 Tax=Clitoria ternatea TaxID=43366 RepID=A0AAN9KJ01_CLITE
MDIAIDLEILPFHPLPLAPPRRPRSPSLVYFPLSSGRDTDSEEDDDPVEEPMEEPVPAPEHKPVPAPAPTLIIAPSDVEMEDLIDLSLLPTQFPLQSSWT